MPKIPDEIVKRVIDLARIEDVVSDFVTLRKAGVNLTGICPFHDDQHDGNFIVRPSGIPEARHGNTYRCFVCDAKGGPVQFLMAHERLSFPDAIRWLGKKYNEPIDDIPLNYTPPPPRPKPEPLPVLEIPRAYVKRTMDIATWGEVTFRAWYMSLPWDMEQLSRAHETLWMYCVGGWKDGRVVFWQIDHNGIPRAAKLMKFYPQGHPKYGHRDKEVHPGWIYNQDGARQQLDPEHHTIIKPLFGSHLLCRYPQAVINIVESEKTALVMANYYGNHDKQIWMACGGLKFLQLDSLQPLIDQGRTIWLWPDKDGREAWHEVCEKLGYGKCHVYTRFFDTCWREEDGDKADVADIAIRMMNTGEGPRRTTAETAGAAAATDGGTAGDAPAGETAGTAATAVEWYGDEPFLDEEVLDPKVREWREKMSRVHSSGWGKWPKVKIEEKKDAGGVLSEHPTLKKLI